MIIDCVKYEKSAFGALLVAAARWCSRSGTAAAEDYRYTTAAAVRIDHHHHHYHHRHNNKNNRLPSPPPPPFTLYSYHHRRHHRRRHRRICWRHRSPRVTGATPPVNTVVWLVTVNNRSAVGRLGGGGPRGRVVVGNAFRVVSVVQHPSEKVHRRVSFFLPFDPAQPLNSPFFLYK